MHAHQFLYYQGRSVWSDRKYDMFCEHHGLNGSGGSDRPCDYTEEVKTLAEEIESNPGKF